MKIQSYYYFLVYFSIAFKTSIPYAQARLRGGGTLKVRISRFSNLYNKLSAGDCCSMYQSATTCWGTCRTFFRICTTYNANPSILRKSSKYPMNLSSLLASADLSKRQEKSAAKKQPFYRHTKRNYTFESSEFTTIDPDRANDIDDSPPSYVLSSAKGEGGSVIRNVEETEGNDPRPYLPCTFGAVVTEVVAGSSLEAEKDGILEVAFPFKAPWPLTFRLVIEAWNEVPGYVTNSEDVGHMERNKTGVLISRHVSRHTLQGNDDWKPFRYQVGEGMAIHYSLRVSCNTPFFGKKCSMRCDSFRTTKNGRVNCTDDENGEVECLEGWTGDLCNKAICREDCHSIHGYCTQPGECKCALGWRGKNCDECVPMPGCKHGFCSNTSYECVCEPGWEGPYCATPICSEGCHSVRGYCKSPGECRCRVGWGGESCESCRPLPGCANGYCTRPLECRCRSGWTGTLCDKPICQRNCSVEHGSCESPGECRCDLGWWGENCDTCFPYPGCEHGSCEKPWECNCKHGWTGMTCSERKERGDSYCDIHVNTCLNGGTCINISDDGNYACSCPKLFIGKHCESLAEEKTPLFPKIKRDFLAARSSFSTTIQPPSNFKNFVTDNSVKTLTGSNLLQPNTTDTRTGSIMSVSVSKSVSMSTSPIISNSKVLGKTDDNESHNKIKLDITNDGLQTRGKFLESSQGQTTEAIRVINAAKVIHEHDNALLAQSQNKFDFLDNVSNRPETPQPIFFTQGYESSPNEDSINFDENIAPVNAKDTATSYREESVSPLDQKDIANDNTKEGELLFEIPFAEELYVEILRALGVKLTETSIRPTIQTPMIILQLLDHRMAFDHNKEFEDSEVGPKSSGFLPQYDSVGLATEDNPSLLPLRDSQEEFKVSNFSSNPYRHGLNYYSLNPVSSRFSLDDFPPKARINRRTGHWPNFDSSSTTIKIPTPSDVMSNTLDENPVPTEKPKQANNYYEENYSGRVHIGDVSEVDRDAPVEEIKDAFIELKKLHS